MVSWQSRIELSAFSSASHRETTVGYHDFHSTAVRGDCEKCGSLWKDTTWISCLRRGTMREIMVMFLEKEIM